ncbi:MAG TPA: ferredoxin [Candidatus Tidjanibacter gallistercoris]|nr:ferredoxin [Candidatus Tidjanibacter gallistercoris]
MILRENESREEYVMSVARAMMTAARTAPKGCGVDNLEIAALGLSRIARLARKMREVGERDGKAFFLRDADNVEHAQAVVLIGTRHAVRGLNCALCGYPTCREKRDGAPSVPCVFDVTDLGIAVGSAVSVAAECRVDNRILYSAGVAARELGFLDDCPIVYAVPLSVSGKNIFFDRAGKCSAK